MKNIFSARMKRCSIPLVSLFAAIASVTIGQAALPPLERILPADTLFVFAVPDVDRLSQIKKTAPQARFWDDPAMKSFKDGFVAKWNAELIAPLERELNIHVSDYTSLPHGQLTFAILPGSATDKEKTPGLILFVDTKDKSSQLKSNLAALRKKWVDAGKTLQTEKLHGIEFMEFAISSEEMPKTLKRFFSGPETAQASADDSAKKTENKGQIVIGQYDSLLIIGNTLEAADSIATRLSGGSAPVLADLDSFAIDKTAVFRDAPMFLWGNVRSFIDLMLNDSKTESTETPTVGMRAMFKPEKAIASLGLNGLKSVAIAYRNDPDGTLTQIFFRAPDSARQGLLKILAPEARDSSPPPFVPADAVKFQRWRLDGQKTWATFEKMLSDFPSAMNLLNYAIESANTMARDKDPAFDLRKRLFGNLGNDFISYQKVPRDTTPESLRSPPAIFLIGSPNPAQIINALQTVFRMISPGGPTEREFLGRKIYTVTIPGNPVGGLPEPGQPFMRRLNYTANASYVALSTDSTMLEEYLRSSENPPKALRETAGLTDAAQKVGGAGTGWFGYENQSEVMRVVFEALRKNAGSTNGANADPFFAAFAGVPGLGDKLKSWTDFSLLPAYQKVSKYFSFTVFAGSSSSDGITFKIFAPTPPGLKN